MDSTERNGDGATAGQVEAAPGESTSPDEIYDVTIIGAGPTGLFGAFYSGMRTLRTKIIDALPEAGGQLAALYPEKYIYDAPGFPKIIAKDLVKMLVEQAMQWQPAMCLGERVTSIGQAPEGHWTIETDKQTHLTRTIVLAAGVGAFAPNKLVAPGVTAFENSGVHYFVKEKAAFKGKDLLIVGGGDSAVDWALNLQDVAHSITVIHRRDEFRAHESSVTEMMNSGCTVLTPYEVKEVQGDGSIERVVIYHNKSKEERALDVDAILVNIGFKADIGPIREWGLELVGNRAVAVNSRMETNLPGVFAAGDIAAEEVKMNLIATGYGQAALAVNVAKHYIDPKASIFPGHSSEKM